jgi:chromosome segregation ATPase
MTNEERFVAFNAEIKSFNGRLAMFLRTLESAPLEAKHAELLEKITAAEKKLIGLKMQFGEHKNELANLTFAAEKKRKEFHSLAAKIKAHKQYLLEILSYKKSANNTILKKIQQDNEFIEKTIAEIE